MLLFPLINLLYYGFSVHYNWNGSFEHTMFEHKKIEHSVSWTYLTGSNLQISFALIHCNKYCLICLLLYKFIV